MQVQSLDWEDPLEEDMATHSSIFAWRASWTEEPSRLQSIVLQRVGHNWSDLAHTSEGEVESISVRKRTVGQTGWALDQWGGTACFRAVLGPGRLSPIYANPPLISPLASPFLSSPHLSGNPVGFPSKTDPSYDHLPSPGWTSICYNSLFRGPAPPSTLHATIRRTSHSVSQTRPTLSVLLTALQRSSSPRIKLSPTMELTDSRELSSLSTLLSCTGHPGTLNLTFTAAPPGVDPDINLQMRKLQPTGRSRC